MKIICEQCEELIVEFLSPGGFGGRGSIACHHCGHKMPITASTVSGPQQQRTQPRLENPSKHRSGSGASDLSAEALPR